MYNGYTNEITWLTAFWLTNSEQPYFKIVEWAEKLQGDELENSAKIETLASKINLLVMSRTFGQHGVWRRGWLDDCANWRKETEMNFLNINWQEIAREDFGEFLIAETIDTEGNQ